MNMIVKSSAVVATAAALPAVANSAIVPAPIEPSVPISTLPTAIESLWKEARAWRRQYQAAEKVCDKLEELLLQQMPDPHPSIVFGNPENDADGLEFWMPDREPHTFKHYIFSLRIADKIAAKTEPKFTKVHVTKDNKGQVTMVEETRTKEEGPFPFTEEELGLHKRLKDRLEVSLQYERERERVSRKIGLTAAERKRDKASDRYWKIYWKILEMPARSRGDLKIKLAIHRHFGDDSGSEEIMSDVRRLANGAQFTSGEACKATHVYDPIFAAIERCKATEAEHDRSCKGEPSCDSPEYEAWYDAQTIACNRAAKSVRFFCKTAPTTIAGIAAAIRFVREQEEKSEATGPSFLALYRENGGGPDCTMPFLTSLCTAFERLGLAQSVTA